MEAAQRAALGEPGVRLIPGLGTCKVRCREDRPRVWSLGPVAPLADNDYRWFVNSFLATNYIESPAVSAEQVDALPEPGRAELRAGLAEFYGLADQYRRNLTKRRLDGDRALFEVLRDWTQQVLSREPADSDFMRPGQSIFKTLFDLAAVVRTVADSATPVLRTGRARWLLRQLDCGTSLTLAAALGHGREELLLSALEFCLDESRFLTEIRRDIAAAPVLSSYPRRHLRHGIDHLATREFIDAWPPLILGVEGAFRDAAYAQGVLSEAGCNAKGERPSIEQVLRVSALDDEFRIYVKEFVYGGHGNDFRHCSERQGARRQCLLLLTALVGLLSECGLPSAKEALAKALHQALLDSKVHLASGSY